MASRSRLSELAPKWGHPKHIRAALRQHTADLVAALGTSDEYKEAIDLGLILEAFTDVHAGTPETADRWKKEKEVERLEAFKGTAHLPDLE